MTHVTCRLTAKNRDQLRNPTLGNRVWATFYIFGFFLQCCQWPASFNGTQSSERFVCGLWFHRFARRTSGARRSKIMMESDIVVFDNNTDDSR